MPEYTTPGVYVEEVSSGVRPIQGVGTSTAAFVGEAARGIPDFPTFISGYSEFERHFGGHRRGEAGLLAQAVQAYFDANPEETTKTASGNVINAFAQAFPCN